MRLERRLNETSGEIIGMPSAMVNLAHRLSDTDQAHNPISGLAVWLRAEPEQGLARLCAAHRQFQVQQSLKERPGGSMATLAVRMSVPCISLQPLQLFRTLESRQWFSIPVPYVHVHVTLPLLGPWYFKVQKHS